MNEKSMNEKKQVWSCGGGRQSCAIAALIIQGKLPKPDVSVISDTGRERFTTFPYLRRYVIPALQSVGITLHIVSAAEWGYFGTSYTNKGGGLMIPAYTYNKKGKPRKNKPDCSGAWKRDVINRWLSETMAITRSKYIKWIGFSRSPKELLRAFRMNRSKKEGGGKTRFPLIELGLTTPDCLRVVEQMGWPEPKVSACWMCPNLKDSERGELTPEEQRMAIEFDREMREKFPVTFLHGSYLPLEQVDLSRPNDLFTEVCDSGNCFV